jgi:hypothetical protein
MRKDISQKGDRTWEETEEEDLWEERDRVSC